VGAGARFRRAQRSRIRQIIARGLARTVASVQPGFDHRPALNYRGKSIDILLKQARIDRVTVGAGRRRAPRAATARPARHHRRAGFHVTTPAEDLRMPALLAARDSSLPLAAAALAQVADERGAASFGELAVAYREEFLRVRARLHGPTQSESGTLSVDDSRQNLRGSVLPRLALDRIVTLPAEPWFDDTPIAFAPDVWRQVAADRAGTATRLLDAARTLARAEQAGIAQLAWGSCIIARLVISYKGRVVDDVSVELEQERSSTCWGRTGC
jgi:hypothetical protein